MNPITFVLPNGLDLGGVTVWSLQMAQKLAMHGTPVRLIDHVSGPDAPGRQFHPNIQYLPCPGSHPFHVTNLQDIQAYLPIYQMACPGLIIPNWSCGTYAACAQISKRAPEQIRVIGLAHADERECYDALIYYAPLIHRFVAVSEEIAVTLRQRLPHRASDIQVRPYAVESPAIWQRTYSQPAAPLKLVYAARLQQRQKRVFDLVQLVELLKQRQVNFALQIIGEGEDEPEMKSRLYSVPDVSHRITFMGCLPHEQMPDIWHGGDICLLVSEYEGTSITMLEAMAHGCVPVVTNVSGTAAVIKPERNGYVVPVGDMSAMAAILDRLAQARDRLPILGEAAYHTIQLSFAYQEYLAWFLDLVTQVWKCPPRGWPRTRPILPRPPRTFKSRLAARVFHRIRQAIANIKHAITIGE